MTVIIRDKGRYAVETVDSTALSSGLASTILPLLCVLKEEVLVTMIYSCAGGVTPIFPKIVSFNTSCSNFQLG